MNFDNTKNLFELQIDLIDGKIEIKMRNEIRKLMEHINNLEQALNQRITKLENVIK